MNIKSVNEMQKGQKKPILLQQRLQQRDKKQQAQKAFLVQ